MQIRKLSIKRFRGIREMTWKLNVPMICLIGPNDSTKTTILDAIEYVVSPRWNLPFTDADFYQSDTDHPIEKEITVGQLPKKLLDMVAKLGLQLQAPLGLHLYLELCLLSIS